MGNPYRIDVYLVTDQGFKLWETATKGVPEDGLNDLSQSKIKAFKHALDEASNKFYLGKIFQAIPIDHKREGKFSLRGNLIAKIHVSTTAKAK